MNLEYFSLITREALEAEIAQLSHKIDNLGARSEGHVCTVRRGTLDVAYFYVHINQLFCTE